MCFVTVPHPLGMISKEEVNAKVDAAFDDIVKAATAWTPSKGAEYCRAEECPAAGPENALRRSWRSLL